MAKAEGTAGTRQQVSIGKEGAVWGFTELAATCWQEAGLLLSLRAQGRPVWAAVPRWTVPHWGPGTEVVLVASGRTTGG